MFPPHSPPASDRHPSQPAFHRARAFDRYSQGGQRFDLGEGSAYATRTSSSLAYALGPDTVVQRRGAEYAYPPEESKPLPSHIGPYGSQTLPTFNMGGSAGCAFDGVVACSNEQDFSMHEYPYSPVDETYAAPTQYHSNVEQGYFQGKIVTTAVLGQSASTTDYGSSPSHVHQTFQGDMTAAPIVMHSPRPPFPLTRSYTLAEAMTPVEDRKPPRLSKFQQAPPMAAPAADASPSPSASPSVPTFPMNDTSSQYAVSPAAMSAASTPPPPADAAALFGKFAANTPFQLVPNHRSSPIPFSPRSPLSCDDIGASDAEGRPTETIIELAVTMPQEPAKKKPTMACLFCRDRKIGCGPPSPDSVDKRCKQCIKRDFKECVFPKESRRGQHKRTPRAARAHALGESTSPQDESMPSLLTTATAARSKSKGSAKRERTPRRATIDVIPHYGGTDSAGPSSATF